jgi:hypothetical protein
VRGLAWTALCALIVSTPGCAGIAEDPPLADAAPGGDDAPGAIDASTPPDGRDGSTTNATPDAEVPPAMDGGRPGEPDASTCSPCELVSQCGCDPETQACDLGGAHPAQGTTVCRPVLVPGIVTDTCNDSTSCAAGYVCLGAPGAASCKRYCDSDSECDGGGGVCVIEVTAGGTPIPGVKVCSPRCDPFTSVGCPAGWGCGPFSDPVEQRNFTWCELSGSGGQNALCSDDGQCQQGFACVQVGSTARCKRYCDRGDGVPGCSAGLTCVGIVDSQGLPLVVDGVAYGVCN